MNLDSASSTKASRRGILQLAAGWSTLAAFPSSLKAETRSLVFGDYTQAELDAAMDQTRWARNMGEVLSKWKPQSDRARETLKQVPKAHYGSRPDATIEIFPASEAGAPIVLFIHGGEWKRSGDEASAFPALTLVPAGCAFLNVSFRAAPSSTLVDMADDVRQALVWANKNAATFGGDPGKLFVVGHSSGAHLAAVLLTTDWTTFGIDPDPICGAVLMSGLYDLKPVLLSMRREWVHLTKDEAEDLSPIRHLDKVGRKTRVSLLVGESESPEFRRQTGELGAALITAGRVVRSEVVPLANHFEIPQTFMDPDGTATRVVLSLVRG